MLQKFVILLANGAQQLSCGSDLVDGNHALHNKGRARPRAIGGQYQYAREPSIRKCVTVPGDLRASIMRTIHRLGGIYVSRKVLAGGEREEKRRQLALRSQPASNRRRELCRNCSLCMRTAAPTDSINW